MELLYQSIKESVLKVLLKFCHHLELEKKSSNNRKYIPPCLRKGIPIRGYADNIDTQVDTYDGRNSFYGTAVSVYQRISPESASEILSPPLMLEDHPTNLDELKSAPSTVVKMKPCRITGAPKTLKSSLCKFHAWAKQARSLSCAPNRHDMVTCTLPATR